MPLKTLVSYFAYRNSKRWSKCIVKFPLFSIKVEIKGNFHLFFLCLICLNIMCTIEWKFPVTMIFLHLSYEPKDPQWKMQEFNIHLDLFLNPTHKVWGWLAVCILWCRGRCYPFFERKIWGWVFSAMRKF